MVMINKINIEKQIKLHKVAIKILEENEFISMYLFVKGKRVDVTKDNRLQVIELVKEGLKELESNLD